MYLRQVKKREICELEHETNTKTILVIDLIDYQVRD